MEKVEASLLDRLRPFLNREVGLYVLLVLIALVIRLWALDARAIHYDECVHVVCGLDIFNPRSWCYDTTNMPGWTHGPFQFDGTALTFFIFGKSEFTARLLPAFFGTALVALPYFLRRQLGRWGAPAVAVLLTFSPLLLYYSRYARNDIYIVFWTLLLIVCMWRYFEERKARYLYVGAAALSFSFCTKEVSYIIVGILALFLLIVSARELAGKVRRKFDLRELSPASEYLIVVGTLSLPLFSAFIQLVPGVDLGVDFSSIWAKVLVISLFLISAAIGLRWNWRRWLISALIFYGILALLYTVFFTNFSYFGNGIWRAMAYWIGEHGVARGGQPWYYYLVLLPIYEFLPLTFAFVGGIYYTIKGNLFSRFLVYWAAVSVILYSIFGEKMPWLSVHMALPIILLGGMFIGRFLQAFDAKGAKAWAIRGGAVLVLLLLFSYTVHVAFQESYQKGDEPPQMLLYAGISSDVPRIMAQIEELAQETGEGKELVVTVDWGVYYNGWNWYLRDYQVDHSIDQPRGSVLIVGSGNEPVGNETYLQKYGKGERITMLTWFPEEYKKEHNSDFGLGWWWGYFLHRETEGLYWTTEGIVYFPKSAP